MSILEIQITTIAVLRIKIQFYDLKCTGYSKNVLFISYYSYRFDWTTISQ